MRHERHIDFYCFTSQALVNNAEKLSLADYLDQKVFAGNTGVEIAPTAEDVAGFDKYIETYKAGLAIEKAAVENKN